MSDMSDELLSLRHERALELLQKPEIKEFFEDRNKRFINITALKEWEEAGEPFEILGIYNHHRTFQNLNKLKPIC